MSGPARFETCLVCLKQRYVTKGGWFRKHNISKGVLCEGSWQYPDFQGIQLMVNRIEQNFRDTFATPEMKIAFERTNHLLVDFAEAAGEVIRKMSANLVEIYGPYLELRQEREDFVYRRSWGWRKKRRRHERDVL